MFTDTNTKIVIYDRERNLNFAEVKMDNLSTDESCLKFNKNRIAMFREKFSTKFDKDVEEELFDGFRAILCSEDTAWKIYNIYPFPGELIIRMGHSLAIRLREGDADKMEEKDVQEARRILKIFKGGMADAKLSHEGTLDDRICRFYLLMDGNSTVEFWISRDETIIGARPIGVKDGFAPIEFKLSWQNSEHTKFEVKTRRSFGL